MKSRSELMINGVIVCHRGKRLFQSKGGWWLFWYVLGEVKEIKIWSRIIWICTDISERALLVEWALCEKQCWRWRGWVSGEEIGTEVQISSRELTVHGRAKVWWRLRGERECSCVWFPNHTSSLVFSFQRINAAFTRGKNCLTPCGQILSFLITSIWLGIFF